MNPETVPSYRRDSLREEGMLFVRTEGMLQVMIKAPLILAGLIVASAAVPPQNSFGLTRSLDLIIYQDGLTHVMSEFDVDPQQPDFQVDLYGSTVDNFVALGEDGFLLESHISDGTATIETFGASSVSVAYDIHDLVSKQGRVWSFVIDAPSDYSLLMPENTVIVGMSSLPISMAVLGEQTELLLPGGSAQIDYIFTAAQNAPPPEPYTNAELLLASAALALAAAFGLYVIKKRRAPAPTVREPEPQVLDPQTIFGRRPDLRDDDKEIVSFIYENGGQARESDLRKKFLQPRTTMWRAVKRLERRGVIRIEKKDQQNLVRLCDRLEDEQ